MVYIYATLIKEKIILDSFKNIAAVQSAALIYKIYGILTLIAHLP